MIEWVCVNGELRPAETASVSVFDAGFMQGVGLFETMRAYRGRVFRLEQHLDRLAASARTLGWAVIPDPEETGASVARVLAELGAQDGRVRLTVTSGSLRGAAGAEPKLTIVASATVGGTYPAELYEQGATVVVSRYRQSRFDPTVGHKTTSYFARLAALREAHAAGALEALWLDDNGQVAEGAISSVFAVRGGRVCTPALETPILPGITRVAVIELAVELGVMVDERALAVADLCAAEEVFLTNSMMEVMPVVRVGGERIGVGRPGEVTRRLAQAYAQRVREECGHG